MRIEKRRKAKRAGTKTTQKVRQHVSVSVNLAEKVRKHFTNASLRKRKSTGRSQQSRGPHTLTPALGSTLGAIATLSSAQTANNSSQLTDPTRDIMRMLAIQGQQPQGQQAMLQQTGQLAIAQREIEDINRETDVFDRRIAALEQAIPQEVGKIKHYLGRFKEKNKEHVARAIQRQNEFTAQKMADLLAGEHRVALDGTAGQALDRDTHQRVMSHFLIPSEDMTELVPTEHVQERIHQMHDQHQADKADLKAKVAAEKAIASDNAFLAQLTAGDRSKPVSQEDVDKLIGMGKIDPTQYHNFHCRGVSGGKGRIRVCSRDTSGRLCTSHTQSGQCPAEARVGE